MNVHSGLGLKLEGFDVNCDTLNVKLGVKRVSTQADIASCAASTVDSDVDTRSSVLDCPAGYTIVFGDGWAAPTCIKYVSTPASHSAAAAACAADGATLASVYLDDSVKREAVASQCFDPYMDCWTGLSALAGQSWSVPGLGRSSDWAGDLASSLTMSSESPDLSLEAVGSAWGATFWAEGFETTSMDVVLRMFPGDTEKPYLCETHTFGCPSGFQAVTSASGIRRCVMVTDSAYAQSQASTVCRAAGAEPFSPTSLHQDDLSLFKIQHYF